MVLLPKEYVMKNNDNPQLLAHKRRIDAKRRADAIAKRDQSNRDAMHLVAKGRK